MTRFILLSSCTTDLDEQGRIKGTLDLPLNETGNVEAERIAAELADHDPDVIYHADCQSARQTAVVLADQCGAKVKVLKNLQNLNHGLWQGKRVEELKETCKKAYRQWQEQPESVCAPEGEPVSDAQSRVIAKLSKLIRKHKNQVVVLILPEPISSLARSYLEQTEIGDLWDTICQCGRWQVIDLEQPPLTLANQT